MNVSSSKNVFEFSSFPSEIKIKIMKSGCLADIFSFMQVGKEYYQTARIAFIEKAQFLGYQKNSRYENFEDAASYIKHLFFRFTHERKDYLFVSKYRSIQKTILNEEKSLNKPCGNTLEKIEFLMSLEKTVNIWENITCIFSQRHFHFEIGKEYLSYFCKRFFNYEMSKNAYNYFPFIIHPQTIFRKFSLLGLFAALIGNDSDLFKEIFKTQNTELNNVDDLRNPNLFEFYHRIKDVEGNNLLHMAAYLGRFRMIRYMFNFKTGRSAHECLEMKNKDNKTPLDLALLGCHKNIVAYFLEKYPKVVCLDLRALLKFVTKTKSLEIEFGNNERQSFFNFISIENKEQYAKEIAQALISLGDHFPDDQIPQPLTPSMREIYLIEAVKNNNFRFVDLWIESESVNAIDENGKTLLEIAIENNNFPMASKLILAGHSLKDPHVVSYLIQSLIKESITDVSSYLRCVIRGGADISGLVLDQNSLSHSYLKTVQTGYRLLKKRKFEELLKEMNHQKSHAAIIDVLIATAIQGNPNTLKFVKDGVVEVQFMNKKGVKVALVEPLFFDMYQSLTKLSVLNKNIRQLIQQWIPRYDPQLNNRELTLLTMAVSAGCKDSVSLLLDKGWSIDKDKNNLIDLHSAVFRNDLMFSHKNHYDLVRSIFSMLLENSFQRDLTSQLNS